MKIVIATPILYNETSPFNHLFSDIIGGFLEDGNQIIRLVACENKKETAFKYGYEGANIEYRLYKRKNSGHSNIFSRYIIDTFTNMRQAIGILRMKDVDVLFEDVSYSSFWPVLAAKIRGLRVVAMLQDVWPDNAVQSQLIKKDSMIYKYFEWWQRCVYKNADSIICISDDMKEFVTSKGVNRDKIEVIYNWGYSDETVDISWDANEFVKKYNLCGDKFYVVYAGNIGRMQNVEVVVEAAKQLAYRKDIRFLIVGDGANRGEIERLSQGIENIRLLPFQPAELATHIYSMASVNLAPIVSGGIKTAMPSKIGICLSCGNPLIVCADKGTKLEQMFNQFACGKVIDSKQVHELVDSISRYCGGGQEKNYRCFKENFCRSLNTSKYVHIVQGEKT